MSESTRVDFYLLEENDDRARLLCAARIASKAFSQKLTLFIQTAHEEMSQELDDLLWTFQDSSFIPHARTTENIDEPILIGTGPSHFKKEVLINLTAETISSPNQWSRIIEIILNSEEAKASGRKRYAYYKSQHCELFTHELTMTK